MAKTVYFSETVVCVTTPNKTNKFYFTYECIKTWFAEVDHCPTSRPHNWSARISQQVILYIQNSGE
jgi:hypothetical protein